MSSVSAAQKAQFVPLFPPSAKAAGAWMRRVQLHFEAA
jgi:hypothetical protein